VFVPSHLIEVAFKGNRREFFLWEADSPPALHAPVIVEADRGEDLGRVHSVGESATQRSRGVPHGAGEQLPAKKARRIASADDVRRHDDLRAQDEEARRKAMDRVRANALAMKVSDAEWQWDKKKLTFYFTAEKRVDFRTLVRELAAAFRTRIELKQIGVRDEAKRLDGIGRCGRQYCSASWLPELRPVSLGVAKDQRLSLNPTQISGACGRLMCSLRYEHEFYVQARRRFPKEGKTVRTTVGEERVISNDIFRERVVLRSVEGETRTIALSQLIQETEAAGGTIIPAAQPRETRGPLDRRSPAPVETRRVAPPLVTPAYGEPAVPDADEEGTPEDEDLISRATSPAQTAGATPATPAGGTDAPGTGAQPAEKRPHRRRGRRGGRRNRGGGGGGSRNGGGGTGS
jgi:cell fate regulator YaaT (PSP1 superfamily)